MRIEETFFVQRAPEVVFDYVTNPAKLASWQTTKRSVEALSGVMKLLEPVAARMMSRQFAGYHRNLRDNVERG
jgi:carbon monoxide dehydrogenase subunit G